MNILDIINEAADRLNEPSIESAFSTVNNQAKMYLSSANKMAREIAKRHNWEEMVVPYSFTTVDGLQEYPLPDHYKEILTNYMYNSTQQYRMMRETSDRAQSYISTGSISWYDAQYRIVQGKIRFTTPADTADLIRFEYKSNGIAKDCSDNLYEKFQDDDSLFTLDDEALIRGIVFDVSRKYEFTGTAVLKQEFEDEITDLITKDGGKYVISSSGEYRASPLPRTWSFEKCE
jgi:hypothetical protein